MSLFLTDLPARRTVPLVQQPPEQAYQDTQASPRRYGRRNRAARSGCGSAQARIGATLGRLLETFVFQELRRQAGWNEAPMGFFHFRDKDGWKRMRSLERGALELAGVVVKAAATVTAADFLVDFASYARRRVRVSPQVSCSMTGSRASPSARTCMPSRSEACGILDGVPTPSVGTRRLRAPMLPFAPSTLSPTARPLNRRFLFACPRRTAVRTRLAARASGRANGGRHLVRVICLGFGPFFEQQLQSSDGDKVIPARIAAEHRGAYEVWSTTGSGSARLAGRLRLELEDAGCPGVGDWVVVKNDPGPDRTTVIERVLARRTVFTRGAAGREARAQVVAANVDRVFVVCGLDADFKSDRIERYLARIWSSGAEPAVILNKVDVCDDVAGPIAEVKRHCAGVPVHVTSALYRKVEAVRACIHEA